MEELNGVTIYWLVSIGLLVAYVLDLIIGRRGMSLAGNLLNGVIASVIIGVLAIIMGLFGALIYAAVGTVAFLFLVNIFSIHSDNHPETRINKPGN